MSNFQREVHWLPYQKELFTTTFENEGYNCFFGIQKCVTNTNKECNLHISATISLSLLGNAYTPCQPQIHGNNPCDPELWSSRRTTSYTSCRNLDNANGSQRCGSGMSWCKKLECGKRWGGQAKRLSNSFLSNLQAVDQAGAHLNRGHSSSGCAILWGTSQSQTVFFVVSRSEERASKL